MEVPQSLSRTTTLHCNSTIGYTVNTIEQVCQRPLLLPVYAALSTKANILIQPSCPMSHEWIMTMWANTQRNAAMKWIIPSIVAAWLSLKYPTKAPPKVFGRGKLEAFFKRQIYLCESQREREIIHLLGHSPRQSHGQGGPGPGWCQKSDASSRSPI